MVQDHGGGGISLHGNIIVPSWTITLDHEGEKGREGAGEQESSSIPPRHGSRRAAPSRPDMGAGEQLHPAPTWEQESSSIPPRHGSTEDGGWRITGWKMIVSQPGGRSRWHVVMEYYCHIIGMEYYCNGILLQYYCEGISMLGQTVPPCDSMFHGPCSMVPCSMVHVPWSMVGH